MDFMCYFKEDQLIVDMDEWFCKIKQSHFKETIVSYSLKYKVNIKGHFFSSKPLVIPLIHINSLNRMGKNCAEIFNCLKFSGQYPKSSLKLLFTKVKITHSEKTDSNFTADYCARIYFVTSVF